MQCPCASCLDQYLYKEQSFHCIAPPTNSAAYREETPKSKKPCPERANVKAVADNRPPVQAPGCAAATLHLKANALYCIEFQEPESNRSMFQHSEKSVGPVVFLAVHANLVFPKDATPLECYGIPQISFLDQLTLAPLLGAEFCQP